MKLFKTEIDKRRELVERAEYVRTGGELRALTPRQVVDLQEYALDIKDIKLYDYLQKFWKSV